MKNINLINNTTSRIILQRLVITLLTILIIRVGSFLPVPGINHVDLALSLQKTQFAQNIVNTFSGKDTFVIGLFTLNILPYINASIFLQLLTAFSPSLSKLQKEGDLSSRRYLSRLTRIITLVWALIQSTGIGLYLREFLFDWNIQLLLEISISLTTGAMIVLWLSELVTEYGLGNGASLLIYINIISNFPNFYKVLIAQNLPIQSLIIISSLLLVSLYGIVLLQEGSRPIQLTSSKELNTGVKTKLPVIANYIPLKLNQAGVMPIILTTTILVFPSYLINNFGMFSTFNIPNLGVFSKIGYWILYFSLILLFSEFYSTIVLNPKDIADQLQKMAVAIPGVRPGIQTNFYLKKVMNRLTLLGALMLALLATLPNLIEFVIKIPNLNGLSTTSLLIMGGVLVDITKEVEEIIFSNIYKKNIYKS